jgi:hypothetical protein
MRAAAKEPAAVSPAELFYGSQLVLPGQLVTGGSSPPAEDFLSTLRSVVDDHLPLPASHRRASTADPSAKIPADLLHARMVFICRDGVRPPLAPAYDGPYTVSSHFLSSDRRQGGRRHRGKVESCPSAGHRRARFPSSPRPASTAASCCPCSGSGTSTYGSGSSPFYPAMWPPAQKLSLCYFCLAPPRSTARPARRRLPPDRLILSSIADSLGGRCSRPV